mmetsp:Transcript_61736/g.116218  ORF Transcript_61736/g.116218 Transcript_61736/m.116218 type:complete len:296 (+) Transcript_61736:387-1274(+)
MLEIGVICIFLGSGKEFRTSPEARYADNRPVWHFFLGQFHLKCHSRFVHRDHHHHDSSPRDHGARRIFATRRLIDEGKKDGLPVGEDVALAFFDGARARIHGGEADDEPVVDGAGNRVEVVLVGAQGGLVVVHEQKGSLVRRLHEGRKQFLVFLGEGAESGDLRKRGERLLDRWWHGRRTDGRGWLGLGGRSDDDNGGSFHLFACRLATLVLELGVFLEVLREYPTLLVFFRLFDEALVFARFNVLAESNPLEHCLPGRLSTVHHLITTPHCGVSSYSFFDILAGFVTLLVRIYS